MRVRVGVRVRVRARARARVRVRTRVSVAVRVTCMVRASLCYSRPTFRDTVFRLTQPYPSPSLSPYNL